MDVGSYAAIVTVVSMGASTRRRKINNPSVRVAHNVWPSQRLPLLYYTQFLAFSPVLTEIRCQRSRGDRVPEGVPKNVGL